MHMTKRYNRTLIRWYSFIVRYADTQYIGTDTIFCFASIFLLQFAYFQFVFASDFFLVKQFLVLFHFALIFLLHFAYFSFVFASEFLVFLFNVNQVKSCLFSHPSETKFSLWFQFSLWKRKQGLTLPDNDDVMHC